MQGSINFDGSLVGNITGGGGGGGDTVVITPVVTSGTKIADISVNGVEKDLYCPTPPTPPQIDITPVVTSGTKIADVSVGGVEKDLYTPDYGADIAALDGRLDIAEGNITNLAGHMTEAETDITEIKQSLSDFETLEKTASGAITTFDDGSDLPMPSLKVSIEPVQSGSGEPSPTNIRPISGWDEVNVSVSGVNIWDEEWEVGDINSTTGENEPSSSNIRSKNYIQVKPNTSYYFCSPNQIKIRYYDRNKTCISAGVIPNNNVITMSGQTYYIRFSMPNAYGTTYNNDISINYPSTDTSYHAYNGHTYTIDLDGTRYGGTLDVVSGLLTITDGYIASYNSEILPSTWISDRDVYAEGTTPTVGAEVVYKLATPQTIQLTPTQVKSLLGDNNVWADTGNIELTYLTNNPLTQTIYDMVKILVEQST